jgi:threonine/homoserine/homoserine lactone efflux protein
MKGSVAMGPELWLKGLVIGFSIAAPVGPIGILCIQRGLSSGSLAGFVSGAGAATADAIYGSIAVFGLNAATALLLGQGRWLHIIGGLFLIYLGMRIFIARPSATAAEVPSQLGLFRNYLSTFFLTLTNPMTILSFAAVYAGLDTRGDGFDLWRSGLMVLGVFCGSLLWWFFLSLLVGIFRKRFDPALHWINLVSGCLVMGFGLFSLIGGIR